MKKLFGILTAVLLVGSLAFAAGELTSYYKMKYLGVNPRVNPRLLSEDEASSASNITLDETGSFCDRDVFGQYNNTSGALGSNSIT
ncbi:MAG: hypothetical protein V1709_10300, partial [Planctomycetota bacterium]